MATQQQKSFKILLIGEMCKDIYHFGVCERLSPEAPIPILKHEETEVRQGMSANVLLNLKALGCVVTHLKNEQEIKKHRFIDRVSNLPLLRVDEGENEKLKSLDLSLLTKESSQDYDAVVISDYNKGLIEQAVCDIIFKKFKDIPVFIDSKKQDLSIYDYNNSFIKINKKEFDNLLFFPEKASLITTLGGKGALYKGKIYPTEKVEVHDVCGAGDVFLSGLVYSFLLKRDLEKSILFSNKLASESVTKFGKYVITKEFLNEVCV